MFNKIDSCLLSFNESGAGLGNGCSDYSAHGHFIELKALFLRAIENLAHRKAAWLRDQVSAAESPSHLYLLGRPLLAALRDNEAPTRHLRAEIYRSIDRMLGQVFGHVSVPVYPPISMPWNRQPERRKPELMAS